MLYPPPHLYDGARWAGLRVGLLGGSFNPPHSGHIHASLCAHRALKLDVIWWLVTPQNPLKSKATRSFEDRYEACRRLVRSPYIVVSDIENRLGVNQTWETIRGLRMHFPATDFVWLAGMDNALTIHRWHNWRFIPDHVAMAYIARPPAQSLIKGCPLRMLGEQDNHFIRSPRTVPLVPRTTYWILQNHLLNISSTTLRAAAYDA